VRVAPEALKEPRHLLDEPCVVRDPLIEVFLCAGVGSSPEEQQIAGFQENRPCELFNRYRDKAGAGIAIDISILDRSLRSR